MKLIGKLEHFRDAALAVERFSGRHVNLPILSYILIQAHDRKITFSATNLELGIIYPILGKVQQSGDIAIPAKSFTQILQIITEDTITLEAHQNELLIITSTSQVKLIGASREDFPKIPTIQPEIKFSLPTYETVHACTRVLPAVATTDLKPELTGVLLAADQDSITFVATDSFRLAEVVLTGEGEGKLVQVIIPQRAIQEMTRIFSEQEGQIHIHIGEHQVLFQCGDVQILSRLIDGNYPPYRSLFSKSYDTTIQIPREEFIRKIRLASVFTSRLNDVALKYTPTSLEVSTTQSDGGAVTATLPIQGKGKSGTTVFNYRYLIDGIEAAGGERIELGLNGVSGAALVTNPSDASFRYLVMPIRAV